MYTKTINDRQVFNECRTILINGVWVSNPTVEQIASEGWVEYIPPVVVPDPITEPDLNSVIQAVKKILATQSEQLTDEEALGVAALYPTWASKIGKQVSIGERLWYDGKLYKVIQAHTIQNDWTPDTAVSLFTDVSIAEWPEFVQPTGAQDAYMIGDKVTFNGEHYESLIDNNTWSPADYPSGWNKVD